MMCTINPKGTTQINGVRASKPTKEIKWKNTNF